jgi:hypothetical protein
MKLAAHVGYTGGLTTEVGVFRPRQNPYAIRRMGLNYLTVSNITQASFAIDACVGGTFALYLQIALKIVRHKEPIIS